MKISASPNFTLNATNQKPPAPTPAPATPTPDGVNLSGQQPEAEGSKNLYFNLAIAGGAVVGGAALGAAAGMHGGLVAEMVALTCVPGLALAGAIVGGVGAEKFGPSSSEYRAIGGALAGGLAGGLAGVAQAFLAGPGSPLLATTLGISGGLMGAAMLFKLAASK